MKFKNCPVLVIGDGKLLNGIVVCMLEAGHPVWVWDADTYLTKIHHLHFLRKNGVPEEILKSKKLHRVKNLEELKKIELAVAVTPENLEQKRKIITTLEQVLPKDVFIGINSESIPLNHIQQVSSVPERVIGLNWAEPAHTTFFLEVISNKVNREEDLEALVNLARESWGKDPYVPKNGQSIRSKLLAALVREAFYLIENGYVTVEDVDRACRNDAGYYLPFAGNCRYMDLMGTSVYGTVMADLNPELSKATHVPPFFSEIVNKGGKGMDNGKGFYTYNKDEKEKINGLFEKFSHQIKGIMSQYSFPQDEKPIGSLSQKGQAGNTGKQER